MAAKLSKMSTKPKVRASLLLAHKYLELFHDSQFPIQDVPPLKVQYILGVMPNCQKIVVVGMLLGVFLPLSYWIPWMVARGNAGAGGLCHGTWGTFVGTNEYGI